MNLLSFDKMLVGINDGRLIGLVIDDINQPELTNGHIASWIAQIQQEFAQK
ncbi:MAG: hypothetical protein AAF490_18530 [Chloroflexota bacterium]